MKGVYYVETYVLVVLWSTFKIMMILATNKGFFTIQLYCTNDFFQAELPENEEVYIELTK